MIYANLYAPECPTGLTENDTDELISNWASRVMTLWQHSREDRAGQGPSVGSELTESCLVRDQINNRLTSGLNDALECGEPSSALLASADRLFAQFTNEASSSDATPLHNHYAHKSEWWWLRRPRTSSRPAFAAIAA